MFVCLRHLLGWVVSVFRSREGTHLGEPRPTATTPGSALKATTPSTEFRRQAVLGRFAKILDWLEEIVDPSHT